MEQADDDDDQEDYKLKQTLRESQMEVLCATRLEYMREPAA